MSNQNNSEPFVTYDSCANEIKNKILKEGIWEPYTERIKNLVKSQEKLWELYNAESSFENKRLILEDIINLQPTISNWYSTSLNIIQFGVNSEAKK